MHNRLLRKFAQTGFPNETLLLKSGGAMLYEADSLRVPGTRFLIAIAKDGWVDYPVWEDDKVKFNKSKRFSKTFKKEVKKFLTKREEAQGVEEMQAEMPESVEMPKAASTGLECHFVEFQPNKWYYVLQDWDCPKGAWDWREYATAYGPFATEEEADEHLRENHANPGGANIERYSPELAKDETLVKVISEARNPNEGKYRGILGATKPKCPHCGSSDYGLMPTDFETAKCKSCGKNWHHGIVPGINDPGKAASIVTDDNKVITPKEAPTKTKVIAATLPKYPPQQAPPAPLTCEIRDVYGDVEEVGHVNTTAEANLWFRERGIPFDQVKGEDDGERTSFTYRKSGGLLRRRRDYGEKVASVATIHDIRALGQELQNADHADSIDIARKLIGAAKDLRIQPVVEAARHYLKKLLRVDSYSRPGTGGYYTGANPMPARVERAADRAYKLLNSALVAYIR